MATLAQTAHLKKAFLEAFAEYGNVTTAARIAGCSRRSAYNWLDTDEDYAAEYREAEIQATERLEEMARERAAGYEVVDETTEVMRTITGSAVLDENGQPKYIVTKRVAKREYNPTLLMFLLKARAPEKYREKYDVTTQGQPMQQAMVGSALPPFVPEEPSASGR